MKPFARISLSFVLSSAALRRGILVSTLALATGCASTLKVDNAPVAALDLNRYLGEWYEIARFDHSFERGVEQAKANYTQNADGTIKVVNSGIKDGKPKTAIGKGKTTDTPGLVLRPVLRRLPRDADRQGVHIRARRQRQRGLSLDSLAHAWIARNREIRTSCRSQTSWLRYGQVDLGRAEMNL